MKIPVHKKNQIFILNNEFVVVVDRWFNEMHHYKVKPLKLYRKNILWHSYAYKSFTYDQLIPTKFAIRDILFANDRTPYLVPLYLEYPELSL
jgi:hypothetical protein